MLYQFFQINFEKLEDFKNRDIKLSLVLGLYGHQAIMYDKEAGVYYGASESRKDGSAMGY